jgi:hypothetical protein
MSINDSSQIALFKAAEIENKKKYLKEWDQINAEIAMVLEKESVAKTKKEKSLLRLEKLKLIERLHVIKIARWQTAIDFGVKPYYYFFQVSKEDLEHELKDIRHVINIMTQELGNE